MLKTVLSIKHYAIGFFVVIALLFSLFGAITYYEVQYLEQKIKVTNTELAKQELTLAIESSMQDTLHRATEFADWQEVNQQIKNPEYYAYWHNHRPLKAGILPGNVSDTALYGSTGKVLSVLSSTTLPVQINIEDIAPYIEVQYGRLEMIAIAKVHDTSLAHTVIGYVAIRINLLSQILQTRHFNYLDRNSIKLTTDYIEHLPVEDLVAYISYSIRPTPVLDEIVSIIDRLLVTMLVVIGLPTLLLYPLTSYLISRPLHRISRHIDNLKNNNASAEMPDFGRMMAISELEKVRDSLNDYHKKLFEVHSRLDDKNKELWVQAHHDALTGAYNRRAFDDHWRNLNEVFSGGRIDICLAIFDVNAFKSFNDSYGHHIGDIVLKGIAHAIMEVLREGEKLYRLGGDEFACVFVGCNEKEAVRIAERCIKEVSAFPFAEEGIREPVRISIGIAHASGDHGDNLDSLQWQADVAMYSAKQPGKSHIAIFTKDLETNVKGLFSSEINDIVYHAITTGDTIKMHYQPIVSLEDLRPAYYEALIRIEHHGKIIMPGDILQLVAARRLEAELDVSILKKIYSDMDSGIIPPGTGVSMNVSGPSIVNREVINQLEKFKRFIGDYRLIIEVTETTLITQLEDAVIVLGHLRSIGFQVALDDFGSGYSSVRYLASMPVDIVKFDISLTRDLSDTSQKTIVRHLASMIDETGHRLVAEGIESEKICDDVKELGFGYGQGYLFGKPVTDPIRNCQSWAKANTMAKRSKIIHLKQ